MQMVEEEEEDKQETDFATIAKQFDKPIKVAAKHLNICPTLLKRICRRHNVVRWPYRKVCIRDAHSASHSCATRPVKVDNNIRPRLQESCVSEVPNKGRDPAFKCNHPSIAEHLPLHLELYVMTAIGSANFRQAEAEQSRTQ